MSQPYMPSPQAYTRSLDHQRSGKRPGGWRRTFKIILILTLTLAALAVAFVVYLLMRLGVNPLDLGTLKTDDSGRTNILILGIGDPGHDGEKLSDTNLVVSLDQPSSAVAMVSVPRDLRVAIPGYYQAKINNANALGGPDLAEQTMSDTLGQPMHYYLQVDFSALKQVVDAVGGLDITVKERLYDPEYPCDNNQYLACGIDIKPGNYHMDGTKVLQYTRCRKGTCGNDFGRATRQQEVLGLLKTKLVTPAVYLNPATLNGLVGVWRSNVTTNMSTNNFIRMVWFMHSSTRTINLVLDESPGGYLYGDPAGSSDLLPVGRSFSRIQQAVAQIFTNPPTELDKP